MIDERRVLAGIPIRVVTKTTAYRGTVLFYHGFMSAIEHQTKELRSLAERGYMAIGVDSVGHGQRLFPDFEARFSNSNLSHDDNYQSLLKDSVNEIPQLVDALIHEGLAKDASLGIAGISMGGYISFGASLKEPRLKVIAPILGSPNWSDEDPESPHMQGDRFYPRALLVQNAGEDVNVPPRFARSFVESLRSSYSAQPERLQYYEFPESSHFMREDDWNELWGNVLQHFDRFLPVCPRN
ncbi:MAG: alpha/beta hydrolase [Planctomycetota bacterium]|nr:alpha/beta hydrolase [Planctomycetota bacterium]